MRISFILYVQVQLVEVRGEQYEANAMVDSYMQLFYGSKTII